MTTPSTPTLRVIWSSCGRGTHVASISEHVLPRGDRSRHSGAEAQSTAASRGVVPVTMRLILRASERDLIGRSLLVESFVPVGFAGVEVATGLIVQVAYDGTGFTSCLRTGADLTVSMGSDARSTTICSLTGIIFANVLGCETDFAICTEIIDNLSLCIDLGAAFALAMGLGAVADFMLCTVEGKNRGIRDFLL